MRLRATLFFLAIFVQFSTVVKSAEQKETPTIIEYENTLTPIPSTPLLGYNPDFFDPIYEELHYEASPLIMDPNGTLKVRVWRYSYNARGIIELDNYLDPEKTAILIAHPWGVEHVPLWMDPNRSGTVFYCTPRKNGDYLHHVKEVLNPFLKKVRREVKNIIYTLPGDLDSTNSKIYSTTITKTTREAREEGMREYKEAVRYHHCDIEIPQQLDIDQNHITASYFSQFPGLIDNTCCRNIPKIVTSNIDVGLDDVVFFDDQGYAALRDFLKKQGIKHILLGGYSNSNDMFLNVTTANYVDLTRDFNVIIIGDATMGLFPGMHSPPACSSANISHLSLEHFITQFSWIDAPE